MSTTAAPTTSAVKPTEAADPVLARIPAAARPETMDGAAAYAAFFFDQLNRASVAGDPDLLNGLSSPSCKTCNSMIASLRDLKDDGNHLSAGPLKVVYSSATVFDKERRQVLVSLKQESVSVLRKDGSVVRVTKPGSGSYVATVSYEGRWTIDRLQIPE